MGNYKLLIDNRYRLLSLRKGFNIGISLAIVFLLINVSSIQAVASDYSWVSNHSIIKVSSSNAAAQYPQIAVDSKNNSHIVWDDYRDGDSQIYYTIIDSNGNKVLNDTRLSVVSSSGTRVIQSFLPSVVVDSNDYIHIFWGTEDWEMSSPMSGSNDYLDNIFYVYHATLDSNGQLISKNAIYSQYIIGGDSWWSSDCHLTSPHAAIDNEDNIHLAFISSMNTDTQTNEQYLEIQYMKLSHDNTILIPLKNVTAYHQTADDIALEMPLLETDSNGYLHMLWQYGIDHMATEVHYVKIDSQDDSMRFLINETILNNSTKDAESVSFDIDSYDNVHLVFSGRLHSGNASVRYMRLDRYGHVQVPETAFDYSHDYFNTIRIYRDHTLHAVFQTAESKVWYGTYNLTTNAPEKYYSQQGSYRSFMTSANAKSPSLGLDHDGNVHIALMMKENRDNYSTYYTTNALSISEDKDNDVSILTIIYLTIILVIIVILNACMTMAERKRKKAAPPEKP